MEVRRLILLLQVLSFHDETFRNSSGEDISIRVFLSGDYEFLCHMYGLSGASGMCYGYYYYLPQIQADFFFQGVTAACGV